MTDNHRHVASPLEQLDEIIRLTVNVARSGEPSTIDYFEELNRRNALVRDLRQTLARIPDLVASVERLELQLTAPPDSAALNHAYAEGRKDEREQILSDLRAARDKLDAALERVPL